MCKGLYTAISINVVGSKYKDSRQDRKIMRKFYEQIHQNQLCLTRSVKNNEGEPLG